MKSATRAAQTATVPSASLAQCTTLESAQATGLVTQACSVPADAYVKKVFPLKLAVQRRSNSSTNGHKSQPGR